MALLRNLLSRRRFPSLLSTLHPNTPYSLKTPPFPHRPITTSSPKTQNPLDPKPQTNQNSKPLHALFMEAVGLAEKAETQNEEEEEEAETETENNELKNKLRQLEEEVRSLKEKTKGVPKNEKEKPMKPVKRSLHSLFTNKPVEVRSLKEKTEGVPKKEEEKTMKLREPIVLKELSPDMEMFVHHLYDNGYFNDANFAKGKERLDLSWFDSFFARGYIMFAAKKFARDNQEIAKWLSGSALKQVAVFGCPSVHKSGVFPAKRLRKFFEVPEDTVCSKCVLRQSCKFINQSVWKGDTSNLNLVVVMKVVTSYALEIMDPQLVVTDEVNKSVSQLLQEVVKLSKTTGVASGF